jgi:hypothetical protein
MFYWISSPIVLEMTLTGLFATLLRIVWPSFSSGRSSKQTSILQLPRRRHHRHPHLHHQNRPRFMLTPCFVEFTPLLGIHPRSGYVQNFCCIVFIVFVFSIFFFCNFGILFFQRLGATLTLSRIYREFRENDCLIRRYTLDLLDNMLFCLKLAENDSAALDTTTRAKAVIASLLKIVTDSKHQKWLLLLESDASRAGADHCNSLSEFSEWLFRQLSSVETVYRRQCRYLWEQIAPRTFSSAAAAGSLKSSANSSGRSKLIRGSSTASSVSSSTSSSSSSSALSASLDCCVNG